MVSSKCKKCYLREVTVPRFFTLGDNLLRDFRQQMQMQGIDKINHVVDETVASVVGSRGHFFSSNFVVGFNRHVYASLLSVCQACLNGRPVSCSQ